MKINIDRMCQLAGVKAPPRSKRLNESRRRGRLLRESQHEELEEMERPDDIDEEAMEPDEMDEMVEIDEAELVQELRRARRIMKENKKIQDRKRQKLEEAQLKAVIDQEVKNVIKELNLNSGWIYGKNKPRRSRHGYTHQGAYLKGIGFK